MVVVVGGVALLNSWFLVSYFFFYFESVLRGLDYVGDVLFS